MRLITPLLFAMATSDNIKNCKLLKVFEGCVFSYVNNSRWNICQMILHFSHNILTNDVIFVIV